MFKCSCGKIVNKIKWINCKKACDYCSNTSLTGQFERRINGDRQEYAKDILQAYNKDGTRNQDFIDAYGTSYYEKNHKYR